VVIGIIYIPTMFVLALILSSLIAGTLLVRRRRASFCMILVIFNFVIFIILFGASVMAPHVAGTIICDLAFSANYFRGLSSSVAQFTPVKVFTVFTHMYIHAGIFHILMNMVFLTLLGVPFEDKVGSRNFGIIYFSAGIMGCVFTAVFAIYFSETFALDPARIGVGASGAIFGILGAFVALYPHETVVFPLFLIRPWPVWMIAGIYFAIETAAAASAPADHVGHFAHLGGLLGGVALAPVLAKYTEVKAARAEKPPDLRSLRSLATTDKLRELLKRIEAEDEPEVRDAWIEHFLKKAKCPHCGGRLEVRGARQSCSCRACGFEIKY
jgi:membrane associated rhomboid family serine protease